MHGCGERRGEEILHEKRVKEKRTIFVSHLCFFFSSTLAIVTELFLATKVAAGNRVRASYVLAAWKVAMF